MGFPPYSQGRNMLISQDCQEEKKNRYSRHIFYYLDNSVVRTFNVAFRSKSAFLSHEIALYILRNLLRNTARRARPAPAICKQQKGGYTLTSKGRCLHIIYNQ